MLLEEQFTDSKIFGGNISEDHKLLAVIYASYIEIYINKTLFDTLNLRYIRDAVFSADNRFIAFEGENRTELYSVDYKQCVKRIITGHNFCRGFFQADRYYYNSPTKAKQIFSTPSESDFCFVDLNSLKKTKVITIAGKFYHLKADGEYAVLAGFDSAQDFEDDKKDQVVLYKIGLETPVKDPAESYRISSSHNLGIAWSEFTKGLYWHKGCNNPNYLSAHLEQGTLFRITD